MAIKAKIAGAYQDVAGVFVKRSGVYEAVAGVFGKAGGSYGSIMAQNRLLIAATNQRYPGTYIAAAGVTHKRGRVPFQIGSGTLTELVVAIPNKWNGNSGDSTLSYPINVVAAYIEDDTTGQLTPVKLAGSESFTVPGNTAKTLCDGISAATLGYPNGVPRGTKFWYRYDYTQTDGYGLCASYITNQHAGASGWYWNPASGGTVSTVNATGPITKTGTVFGGSSSETHAPIILGRFKEASARSTVTVGDSLMWGSNATQAGVNWRGFSVPAQSLYAADGVSDPIAGINISRSGNTADDMMGSNTATWAYFEYATHGFEDLGTNDVGAASGNTNPSVYSQLLTRKKAIWAGMRAAGISKVGTMMLLPNTTSTDGYATLENQTAASQWGSGGLVDSFRDTLLAQVGQADGVDAVVDFDAVRWPGARWAWVSAPANPYHWGDALQALAAPDLRAFWLS